jgi:hypothetical protein
MYKTFLHFLFTTFVQGSLWSDKYLASYERDIIYINAETRVGLQVKRPLLLSEFSRTPQYDILVKSFQLFLNCFKWTVGQTERYYENNWDFFFATFRCECARYIETL